VTIVFAASLGFTLLHTAQQFYPLNIKGWADQQLGFSF